MSARYWVSPLPPGVTTRGLRVYRPCRVTRVVAERICDWGWKGKGVHVFRWPCGTVAVTRAGTPADECLLRECEARLLATYARHDLHRGAAARAARGDINIGPALEDVLEDLVWSGGVTA